MKIYEGLFALARLTIFIFVFIVSWRYFRKILKKTDIEYPGFFLYFLCSILASVISLGAVVLLGFIIVVIGGLFAAIAG